MTPLHALPSPENVVRLPTRHAAPLSKRQLARELNRSPRWIELRMREGLPSLPRQSKTEHTRFDFAEVKAWLTQRAEKPTMTLEQRIAHLEAQVASLQSDRRAI